ASLKDMAAIGQPSPAHRVEVFTPEKYQLLTDYDEKRRFGVIRDPLKLKDLRLEYALGLRGGVGEQLISDKDIAAMQQVGAAGADVDFELVDATAGKRQWRFNRDAGYALTRYQAINATNGMVGFETVNSDFTNVNDTVLPKHISIKHYYYGDGKRQVVYEA